jgi:phosphoglycerol transferase
LSIRGGFLLKLVASGALIISLVAPSALATLFYFAPASWLITNLCGALAFTYACVQSPPTWKSLSLFTSASALTFIINALLAVSFFTQGTGFNDQFFEHLNIGSIQIALIEYRSEMALLVAACLISAATPKILSTDTPRQTAKSPRLVALALSTLVIGYPTLNLVTADLSSTNLQGYESLPQPSPSSEKASSVRDAMGDEFARADETIAKATTLSPSTSDQLTAPGLPTTKNIILVYAEQLEQLYFDLDAFPENPMPKLSALYAQSLRYQNVVQVAGTSWTTAGIIASQCGFGVRGGIHFGNNSRLASVNRPYPDAQCLGDLLKTNGYETVFIGGAPLAFGGKGRFLSAHGFDRVYGWDELQQKLENPQRRSVWGLHDDDLFSMALQEIQELEARGSPYFLSLLTLTTHHPKGVLSPACTSVSEGQDPMLAALQCTDLLLSQFLRDIRAQTSPENTVIAVFSDHLALRNTLTERLRQNEANRRLLFFVMSEDSADYEMEMSHFDVGPTLLDSAGFPPGSKIGFGSSHYKAADSASTISGPNLWAQPRLFNANVFKDGIRVDLLRSSLLIGETAFSITSDNGEFDAGFFMLVVEESGELFDIIHTYDPTEISKSLDGKAAVVIGRPSPDAQAQLYVGRLSETSVFKGRTFVIQDTLALSGEQISDLISRSDFPGSAPNVQSARTSFIAHAGGALQKNTYTNSLEALESNKAHFDLFEMDLIFTSDNELVCLHDWDVNFERLFNREVTAPLKLEEFRALLAGLEITPCDLSSLMGWLSKNLSKYIVTDIKERNIEALEQIAKRHPELMDQIVPQVYQWGEYSQVAELGYDKIIFTLYALGNLSIPRLLQDISENEYFAVTFPKSIADDLGQLLASRGVRTYVHTVNKMQEAKALKEKGVWGVYTDFLHD